MLKINDKIKVHIDGVNNKEIKTAASDKIFDVKKQAGKLGIDYNINRSPYTCKGEIFTPFNAFATSVIFENVETGERYFYSNLSGDLETVKAENV